MHGLLPAPTYARARHRGQHRGAEARADDDGYGRFDAILGDIAEQRQEEHAAARDELAALEDGISRLDNEKMREVLRRKMAGYSSAEIADELALTVANVDQLCSRGVRKLREVMSDD